MINGTKPSGFPDQLELVVNGVPVTINYVTQNVVTSMEVDAARSILIALYLKKEGFIILDEEGEP